MNNTIRCAILGTGVMGKRYAALLDGHQIEGMSLAAVCCRSEASQKWARDNLSASVFICGSEDELYAHSDAFDAVLVVTPHKLHPAMTIRALNEGKHVMCDKPTGITAGREVAHFRPAFPRLSTVLPELYYRFTTES